MGRNFIGEAQALATKIEALGFADQAREIRDAIDFASTGSEILTGLRFHLHQLEKAPGVPADVAAEAHDLAEAIHATLIR